MDKFTAAMKKAGLFIKKNSFYLLIVMCIISLATIIGLAVTRNNNSGIPDQNVSVKPIDPDINNKPTDETQKLTFIYPTNGTISQNFTDTSMVWYESLKQYTTHEAVDFTSEDNKVFASAKGVVKEISHDDLNGNYVIITHENGYETGYYSLENIPQLTVGQAVTQGQFLGNMSISAGIESASGAHLHFVMWKDAKVINPTTVLISEQK